MIKTAIKHYIYDFCIDQVFNGIRKNLMKGPEEEVWTKLKMGSTYWWIVYDKEVYESVRIVDWISKNKAGEIFSPPKLVVAHQKFNQDDNKMWTIVILLDRELIHNISREIITHA